MANAKPTPKQYYDQTKAASSSSRKKTASEVKGVSAGEGPRASRPVSQVKDVSAKGADEIVDPSEPIGADGGTGPMTSSHVFRDPGRDSGLSHERSAPSHLGWGHLGWG
jgi:hypothetical protein